MKSNEPALNLGELKVKLLKFVREHSYREGDFTLASGKKSSFYVDLKATTLHPEGAWLIGRLTVERVREAGLVVDAVGGLTLGADPIATAVSLAAHEIGITWPAYIVRKESKGHGTGKSIEGTENLKPGARCLVLEDVVTTGGSSLIAIAKLREGGYVPAAVLTVVDRLQGGREAFAQQGVELMSLCTLDEIRALK